ncbi:hypothetical protein [Bacillus marasmi]|uniref:hypothetical protein n=1 Tax=Bacillus marasmi TaxID=1926279 RepID=UPI001FEA3431|nr:hypothetical protein [Bacillus marasmi]
MMEWTLAILFLAAIILFILSINNTKQSSKDYQQQIDHITFSLTDEINKLQEQVRFLELDAEITAHEAGYTEERTHLKEMIDMNRRGYSNESIAGKYELTAEDVEQKLAPYIKPKTERGKAEHDS